MQVHGKSWSDNFNTQSDHFTSNIIDATVESSEFPLNDKCFSPEIIYRADVSTGWKKIKKLRFSIGEAPFKESYSDHTKNFKSKVRE